MENEKEQCFGCFLKGAAPIFLIAGALILFYVATKNSKGLR